MNPCVKHLLVSLGMFLCLASLAPAVWSAELTADVDRQEIGVDETLQLIVRINEQVSYGNPDFDSLKGDFDILEQQRSNQFRAINGRTEGWTQWSLTLAPQRTGTLTIPALNFQGAQTDPLDITVKDSSSVAGAGNSELYAEVTVNKERLFVQEELLVTVRIFSAVNLREFAEVDAFDVDNAVVEKLAQTGYRKQMGGRIYRVEEITYGVYPQESGELTIPALQWRAVVVEQSGGFRNDPFFRPRGDVRRIRSTAKNIQVEPQPTHYRGRDWLPARKLELEQHWSQSPERFVVGEPITRTLTLRAEGLQPSQLPPLPNINQPGVRSYSDQPQYDKRPTAEGMTSARIESLAVIANQPGKITLPAVTVDWWDTAAGRQRTASLPEQTITVAPAPGGAQPTQNTTRTTNEAAEDTQPTQPAATPAAETSPWLWLLVASNVALALLAVSFAWAWWRSRSQQQRPTPATTASPSPRAINQVFQQLRRACSDGDAQQARQLLGDWGQRFWRLPHTASLDDIQRRANSPPLTKELATLDKILYGNQSVSKWDGKPLWRALVDVKQQQQRQQTDQQSTDALPPLYPTR